MAGKGSEPYRVLIVDDEPAARRGVAQLLAGDASFEIVGECRTGLEMVDAVESRSPDLVFLDVQMPGLDGFGVLARIDPEAAPQVIFVTGYDRYAVRAFATHAIDFLLKPYTPARFRGALEHAKSQLRQRRLARGEEEAYGLRVAGLIETLTEELIERTTRADEGTVHFLVKKTGGRVRVVSADSVRWIEAARDYVRLHTADGTHLIRETMRNVERRLSPSAFVRVHRSTIVRLAAVTGIEHLSNGRVEVVLDDGSRHDVSRSGRRRLEERLGGSL